MDSETLVRIRILEKQLNLLRKILLDNCGLMEELIHKLDLDYQAKSFLLDFNKAQLEIIKLTREFK